MCLSDNIIQWDGKELLYLSTACFQLSNSLWHLQWVHALSTGSSLSHGLSLCLHSGAEGDNSCFQFLGLLGMAVVGVFIQPWSDCARVLAGKCVGRVRQLCGNFALPSIICWGIPQRDYFNSGQPRERPSVSTSWPVFGNTKPVFLFYLDNIFFHLFYSPNIVSLPFSLHIPPILFLFTSTEFS